MSRDQLLASAKSFCNAFSSKKPLLDILDHFSKSEDIFVLEHGLPQLAPFLGRKFSGVDGVRQYFEVIAKLLSYEDMHFFDFVVDAESSKVSLKGNARFNWIDTSQSWGEVFVYMLEFDTVGKITKYEIWADTGAAYLASKAKLEW